MSPFKFLKLTDFHQTWYEQYATKLHTNAIYSNFLQSVKTKWHARTCDVTNTRATYICISKELQDLFRYYFETMYNTISTVKFFPSLQFSDWNATIHYAQCRLLKIWQQRKPLVLFDEFNIIRISA